MENLFGHQICSELIYDIINQFDFKRKNMNKLSEFQFISTVSIDDIKFSINFVKTRVQNSGALCGFHCIFNLIHFLTHIKFKEKNDTISLYKMNSSVKYILN